MGRALREDVAAAGMTPASGTAVDPNGHRGRDLAVSLSLKRIIGGKGRGGQESEVVALFPSHGLPPFTAS